MRQPCSLSQQGDLPEFLGKLHPRFNTPTAAIILFAAGTWLLAATGAYLWIAAVGAGTVVVLYVGACAALIRLRRKQPEVDAWRVPFGNVFALIGISVSLAALAQLHFREAFLMMVTALIATANWYWARRREANRTASGMSVVSFHGS